MKLIRNGACYRTRRNAGGHIIQLLGDDGKWGRCFTGLGLCSLAVARRVIERGHWIKSDKAG